MASTNGQRRIQAERSEETTTRLLATARELFGRDGYAGTSLTAVVEAAGVTKGPRRFLDDLAPPGIAFEISPVAVA